MELPELRLHERFALRRSQQATIAVLSVLLAAVWLTQWVVRGGWSGGLLRISESHAAVRFEVNVNQAAWPELAALPRIGETLAKRIIETRDREGPFRTLDELQRVHGIGAKTVDGIRPYAVVRSTTPSVHSMRAQTTRSYRDQQR